MSRPAKRRRTAPCFPSDTPATLRPVPFEREAYRKGFSMKYLVSWAIITVCSALLLQSLLALVYLDWFWFLRSTQLGAMLFILWFLVSLIASCVMTTMYLLKRGFK